VPRYESENTKGYEFRFHAVLGDRHREVPFERAMG
jgi:hypothetical protein